MRLPVILFVMSALGACSPAKKTSNGVTDKGGRTAINCGDLSIGEFAWYNPSYKGQLPTGMPVEYETFAVDTAEVHRYFSAFRDAVLKDPATAARTISLPLSEGCTSFNVRLSGAVSPDLIRKYPNMISLQGNGVAKRAYDLRLDWDGTLFRGLVQTGGATILLEPLPVKGNTSVYYIYDKRNTSQQKQPFESTPKARVDR